MLRRSDIEDAFTLTPLQQGMLSYAIAGLHAFQERTVISLRGPLNVTAFAGAWQALADRHGALRTAFVWKDVKVPHHIVFARVALRMRLVDATRLDAAGQERLLARLCTGGAGVALDRAPLLSLVLVRVGAERVHLVWTISHLITDAFSFSILMEDLLLRYRLALAGRPWDTRRAPSFRDYVGWLKRQDPAPAIALWEHAFDETRRDGHRPAASVPPADDVSRAATRGLSLSSTLTATLQAFAGRQRIGLFVVFLGTLALVQRLLTHTASPVIGIVTSCRALPIPRLDAMVGLVMNTVPVPIPIAEHETPDRWLADLAARLPAFLQFEHVPFQRLQEICATHGRRAEIAFNFLNVNRPLARGPGFEVTGFRERLRSSFPLGIDVTPGREVRIEASYLPARFEATLVGRLLAQWRDVLALIPGHDITVGSIVRHVTKAAADARASAVEARRAASVPAWIR